MEGPRREKGREGKKGERDRGGENEKGRRGKWKGEGTEGRTGEREMEEKVIYVRLSFKTYSQLLVNLEGYGQVGAGLSALL